VCVFLFFFDGRPQVWVALNLLSHPLNKCFASVYDSVGAWSYNASKKRYVGMCNMTLRQLRVVGINGIVELFLNDEDQLDEQFRGLTADQFLTRLGWEGVMRKNRLQNIPTCPL
jgi:hypothetical protein